MNLCGIRGAITADANTASHIEDATYEMMSQIIVSNGLQEDDVVSIIFTATKDLDAQYPSVVVRNKLNWTDTPILNFEEKDVVGSLKKCIRVLMHVNSQKGKKEMVHVYLKGAVTLRPDICIK